MKQNYFPKTSLSVFKELRNLYYFLKLICRYAGRQKLFRLLAHEQANQKYLPILLQIDCILQTHASNFIICNMKDDVYDFVIPWDHTRLRKANN